jgi:hypothetical protein
MKKHLHWVSFLLFAWALGYDLVVWGGAAHLADVGDKLRVSAQRNALLGTIYITAGDALDNAVPFLDDWGKQRAQTALEAGIPRIKDDPNVAMDLIFSQTWNATHGVLKFAYWAAPVLGFITLVLFARRPKKIHMMGGR